MSASSYPHLSPAASAIAEAELEIRVRNALQDRFVRYPQLDELLAYIDWLLTRPPSCRAEGVVVVGASGAGKTTLGRAALRKHGHRIHEDAPPEAPVVMISMTAARGARTLFERLAIGVGVPELVWRGDTARERSALDGLRRARTRVVLIDEIQDLLKGSKREREEVLSVVRLIMNEAGVHIIALGVGDAPKAMRLDPHLEARFEYRELPVWQSGDELAELLAAFERDLPLRRRSRLEGVAMMRGLVSLSDGSLRKIARLLTRAAAAAIASGAELIELKALEALAVTLPRLPR